MPSSTRRVRRHLTPFIVGAGVLSTAALALASSGVLSGFTASITNSANSVATGTLLMQEDGQGQTCLSTSSSSQIGSNAGTCTAINKFGAGNTLSVPGSSYSTSVTIKNAGSVAASSFSLAPSACLQTTPVAGIGSDLTFCAKVLVSIENDTATPSCLLGGAAGAACPAVPTASLADWTTALNLGAVAAGDTRTYKFTVMIAAAADNTDQGLAATEPLTWTFNS